MPFVDILSAALSGPAGRLVEGPVRTIVHEVLRDHGYASPDELQALRDDLAGLSDLVTRLSAEVEALREEAARLQQRAAEVPAVEVPAAEVPAADGPAAESASEESPTEESATEESPAEETPLEEAGDDSAAEAAHAERLGMSLADYHRWRTEGLPGVIGPDGYIEINGVAYRVDPSLEGRPYTLTRHKNPRVRVDGTFVAKTKIG